MEESVPCEVITSALFTRFRSRQDNTFAEKLLSAMRNKFGGHVEQAAAGNRFLLSTQTVICFRFSAKESS